MVETSFALILTLIGVVILGFSLWWTAWILEFNPLIPKERGNLQFHLVFLLLWSCWFVAFSFTHADLSDDDDTNKPSPDNTRSEITMATYAVCCVGLFVLLLLWDCFMRGEPPHIIPPFSLFLALLFSCCLLVPGLSLLSIYCRERESDDSHRDYIDKLKVNGIVGVSIGSLFNLVGLTIWIQRKFVKASLERNRAYQQELAQ
jgi:hypothetical protein